MIKILIQLIFQCQKQRREDFKMHLDGAQQRTVTFQNKFSSRMCWESASPRLSLIRSSLWLEEVEVWASESCWLCWSWSREAPERRNSNVSPSTTIRSIESGNSSIIFPISVIYGLLAVETGAYIERAEITRFFLENDGAPAPASLSLLFSEGKFK